MDKGQAAIERLKIGAETSERYYNAPLIICYSGGNLPTRGTPYVRQLRQTITWQ